MAVMDMGPHSAIHSIILGLCTGIWLCVLCNATLPWFSLLSTQTVSKQGLMPEEEVFTHYLLTCVALDQAV